MTRDQLIASLTIILGLSGATAYSDALWADTAFCTIPDPKSGLTCDEIKENPEADIYYIVNQTHFDDPELWELSHEDPETVRWNNAGTQFILKYDGPEIPRGSVGALLGLHNPKTHEEIVQTINSVPWQINDPFEPVVKKDDPRDFVNVPYADEIDGIHEELEEINSELELENN